MAIATSICPRVALQPAICQDVAGDDYAETYLAWRSAIPVFTGRTGSELADLIGSSVIDPASGAMAVQHHQNYHIGEITLSGVRPAPWARDVGLSVTCVAAGATEATVTIDHQVLTLAYTIDETVTTLRKEFRHLRSWTLTEAVAWVDGMASWTAVLDDDADGGWEMSDAVRMTDADALEALSIEVIHSVVGHAPQGTMEAVTTVALGGAITIWNTHGECSPAKRGPAVPGPQDRAVACWPGTVEGCPKDQYNMEGLCQRYDEEGFDDSPACLACPDISPGNIHDPCSVWTQGVLFGHTTICNALGIGTRGTNPIYGLRITPHADKRPLDLDERSWLTQFGEYDAETVWDAAELLERCRGGHAKYYPGSFDVSVCPCHHQLYCGGDLGYKWLCHWIHTNTAEDFRLFCSGPWGPRAGSNPPHIWPHGWQEDPTDPQSPALSESLARPMEVELDTRRQLVFIDLSTTSDSCFPLTNVFCFTDHSTEVLIWTSVGDSYPHMATALEWLALDFGDMRFTTLTGPGQRYPQTTPSTMTRRTDILHCYTSAQRAIGPTWPPLVPPYDPVVDSIRPTHDSVINFENPVNNWSDTRDWPAGRVVKYSTGANAGDEIPVTVTAYFSGIEFPARLELTRAVLSMHLNVETLNGPVIAAGGGDAPASERYGATVDIILTCRVTLTAEAAAVSAETGLNFLNPGVRTDLRFDHDREFAVVQGPEGERIPLTVRWRGVRGPYPYAKGWDPRWDISRQLLHGYERRGWPGDPVCCHAHNVIHGGSIYGEVDHHEAEVPDDLDAALVWTDQLCEGRLITWVPAQEIPGVWGAPMHYLTPAGYTCGNQ